MIRDADCLSGSLQLLTMLILIFLPDRNRIAADSAGDAKQTADTANVTVSFANR